MAEIKLRRAARGAQKKKRNIGKYCGGSRYAIHGKKVERVKCSFKAA